MPGGDEDPSSVIVQGFCGFPIDRKLFVVWLSPREINEWEKLLQLI
jgi:hypothetical protein